MIFWRRCTLQVTNSNNSLQCWYRGRRGSWSFRKTYALAWTQAFLEHHFKSREGPGNKVGSVLLAQHPRRVIYRSISCNLRFKKYSDHWKIKRFKPRPPYETASKWLCRNEISEQRLKVMANLIFVLSERKNTAASNPETQNLTQCWCMWRSLWSSFQLKVNY